MNIEEPKFTDSPDMAMALCLLSIYKVHAWSDARYCTLWTGTENYIHDLSNTIMYNVF